MLNNQKSRYIFLENSGFLFSFKNILFEDDIFDEKTQIKCEVTSDSRLS